MGSTPIYLPSKTKANESQASKNSRTAISNQSGPIQVKATKTKSDND